jgi:hypothetical protein
MKLLLPFVWVATLFGGSVAWRTGPVRHLKVGQYRYDIALKVGYAHDDNADNTYFVVTRANSAIQQCSGIQRSIARPGVLLTTGAYAVSGSHLLFIRRYYGPRRVQQHVFPDSVVLTFSPDRTGQLKLMGARDYTQGKVKDVSY